MSIQTLLLKIERFTKDEKQFLFTFLKNTNVQYSKNKNGYFFRLNSVDKEFIAKLTEYVSNIESHRNAIIERELEREREIEYYKNIEFKQKNDEYNKFIETYEQLLQIVPLQTPILIVKQEKSILLPPSQACKKKYTGVYKNIVSNMNRIKKEFNKFNKCKQMEEEHVSREGEDVIGGGEDGDDLDVVEEGMEELEEGIEELEEELDVEEEVKEDESEDEESKESRDEYEDETENNTSSVNYETKTTINSFKKFLQYKEVLIKAGYIFKEHIVFEIESLLV